jgi:mannose/cellobiose epimerase-like protein (N-acyl-D-glucosamine 2-epimerase family)
MAVALQIVFKPGPGTTHAKLTEWMSSAAALTKKHGAAPRFWAVSVGEYGNMVFSAEFASMAEYGKWMDALNADPAFHASRAKTIETGVVQFVRSNLVRELTL